MPASGAPVVEPSATARFVPVSVAGAPTVQVCIDPRAGDPVAAWFTDHDWIDEPVQRAFLDAVRSRSTHGRAKVLDLGSHLGLFSLSASALGAEVLAVDANDEHARLLSLAADRNGFDDLHVANVALADVSGEGSVVRFVPRSIHGHVLAPGADDAAAVEVAATSVDRLLADLDWDRLDVVKMDIEGSEMAALRGMSGLLASGCRPTFVIESNAAMLSLQRASVPALRGLLEDLGYELFLIDHLRPGVLVLTTADAVQTESASDLLAVPRRPDGLGDRWQIEPSLSRIQVIARLLDGAASPAAGYRRHSAELLRHGPRWLRESGAVRSAIAALDLDVAEEVRDHRGGGSIGDEYVDAAEPEPGDPVDPLLVWAEDLALRWPRVDMERHPLLGAPDDEIVLRDLSFHVNRGEPIGIVAADPQRAELLLAALDRHDVIAAGTLAVRGHVVSLRSISDGLEPTLSIRDNVVLLGAFLGCHAPAVEATRPMLLDLVGLSDLADQPLHDVGAVATACLALAVAFECTRPDLLLLGDLPVVGDGPFRSWLLDRATHLHHTGTAIVQVVHDPAALCLAPNRVMWLAHDHVRAMGHAESVIESVQLDRLGFGPGRHWRHRGARP